MSRNRESRDRKKCIKGLQERNYDHSYFGLQSINIMNSQRKCELFGCNVKAECKTALQYGSQHHDCSEKCTDGIKSILCGECSIQARLPKRCVFTISFVSVHLCISSAHD